MILFFGDVMSKTPHDTPKSNIGFTWFHSLSQALFYSLLLPLSFL